MQTGFVLFYVVFPIFLDGCCERIRQKRTKGLLQVATYQHYRAVEGEIFMMPCIQTSNPHTKTTWSRTEEGVEGNRGPSFDCGKEFAAKVKHSGKYTSLNGTFVLHLHVVEKISLGCFQLNETVRILQAGSGELIYCPGHACSNNTGVVWYQKNKTLSTKHRHFCNKEGRLELCTIFESDAGVFFCDRQIIEKGVKWIFRRAVNVTVIPPPERLFPKINHPVPNITEEVEIGQPHTLRCNVSFYFENEPSYNVTWFMNYGGNMENMTLLHMENPQWSRENLKWTQITQTAIIQEVTPQHLNHTYTCTASNVKGKSSVTITLQKKIQVKWPSLVGYPFVAFLVIVGLGSVLYVKWLELRLIYRSHFQYGKYDGGNKEFDVFLSFVWGPPSAQVQADSTFSSRSGPLYEEAHVLVKEAAQKGSTCINPFNTEESKVTQTKLEVLLPQVLEDQWGYRLCLLERDVVPGGAYTSDVVLGINRSQMLICVLSPEYLTNSNAVFVLESGVQALLQKSVLKLLLIWTSGASASLVQPDPPLPRIVQRALSVLPSLRWNSDTSPTANSIFWSSLRKAMPDNRRSITRAASMTKL